MGVAGSASPAWWPLPPSRPPSAPVSSAQPWEDQTPRPTPERRRPGARAPPTPSTSRIDFDDGSTATVFRSESEGRAVLVTRRMAAPPDRQGLRAVAARQRRPDEPGRADEPQGRRPEGRCSRVTPLAATGVGITVEPEGGSEQPTTPTDRDVRARQGRGMTGGTPRRVAVIGSGVAGLTAAHVLGREAPGDPLRGRRPPRRPRRHPRRRARRPELGDRHRLHRPQRAHLPPPAAALRRARRADPGVRDVDVGALRRRLDRLAAWSTPARSACPACSPPGATRCGRRTCGCSWRSPASTAAPGACSRRARRRRRRRRRDARRVPRPRRLHPAVPHATSWSRWSPACGPATRPSRWSTPPATCSASSSTTACSGSSARRSGAPSPAARGSTSSASPPALADVRTGTKVTSVARDPDRASRSPTATAAPRPSTPSSSPPTPTRRWRCWPSRPPRSARCSRAMPYSPNTAQLHTDDSVLPRLPRARGSWNYLRRPSDVDRTVTVSYDMTRLMRLPECPRRHALHRHPRRPGPRRPVHRDRHDGVRAPDLHPRLRGRPAPPARVRQRPARLRRRLARLGLPRGRRPLRRRGGRPARRRVGRERPPRSRSRPRRTPPRSGTPAAGPFKRTFTHRSRTWLVDLDHLPRPAACSAPSRRATTSATPSGTLRGNVEHFLRLNGVEPDGGRILMAANARALGYCFNPISVFWCHRRDGALAGVVVEVHNTYGDRHAYLVHPDEQGRARTEKQMYVSPFHGTDGYYEIAVPRPGRPAARLGHPAQRRRRRVHAPRLDGVPASPVARCAAPRPRSAAPCSSASTASGCGPAGSGSVPGPTHHRQEGVQ